MRNKRVLTLTLWRTIPTRLREPAYAEAASRRQAQPPDLASLRSLREALEKLPYPRHT